MRYLSSDEFLDRMDEVIRQAGWTDWDRFYTNPIVVDCHDYGSSKNVIGGVIRHEIKGGKQLFQDVEFAVEKSALAADIFGMVESGFLRGCSVGFRPISAVGRRYGSTDAEIRAVGAKMGLGDDIGSKLKTVYLSQRQLELSTCPLGANPNALVQSIAKAHTAGALSDEGLERYADVVERAFRPFPQAVTSRSTDPASAQPADDAEILVRQERNLAFLREMQSLTNRL